MGAWVLINGRWYHCPEFGDHLSGAPTDRQQEAPATGKVRLAAGHIGIDGVLRSHPVTDAASIPPLAAPDGQIFP